MIEFEYDDRELQKLFADMDPKLRMKVMKGAFRRESTKVRRVAVRNLRNSLRSNRGLEKGIRASVYRRVAGFKVTIGSKKMKQRYKGKSRGVRRYGAARLVWSGFDMHTNRQGKEKPVLIWAEGGTGYRRTKERHRHPVGTGFHRGRPPVWGRWSTGRSRGRMPRYAFMEKTLNQTRGPVTEELHKELRESVIRVAKKHGCI